MTAMTPKTPRTLTFVLLCAAALAVAPACTTDHVNAEVIELTSAPAADRAPLLVTWKTSDEPAFFLRFNGLDAVMADETPSDTSWGQDPGGRPELMGNGGLSANIAPGDYVVELVDADDHVFLRTPRLTFVLGQANSLFVHGPPTSIEHTYQSVPWRVMGPDRLYAAFANGAEARAPGRLELCDTELTVCTEVTHVLAYGDTWAGEVDRGQRLRFVPDVDGGEQLRIVSTPLGDFYQDPENPGPPPSGLYFHTYNLADWQPSADVGCDVGCGVAVEVLEFRPE